MGADMWRCVARTLVFVLGWGIVAAGENAPPAGFLSIDPRLPNPDRPYEMTSETVFFGQVPFALYALEFQPRDPSQLDVPSLTPAGGWEFDSQFDISYKAMVSFGLGPVYEVSGIGKARMRGAAPAVSPFEPQVFDSELVALNLYALSPIPEVYFRESPTQASKGFIIREDSCPPCASPLTRWRIASFFDVYGEYSYGGTTWAPGDRPFRIEQAPGPGIAGDYNLDGAADTADYVVLQRGLAGGMYSPLDVRLWRANFGNATAANAGAALATVPEPTSYWTLLFITLLIPAARCRRVAGATLQKVD